MKHSHIQWTDSTFNPWEGCTKVSAGCAHCYAETRNQRFSGGANWGKGAPRRRTSAANWKAPLKWNREMEGCHYSETRPEREFDAFGWRPHRARVFCASLADWLDDEVPIEWTRDLLSLIAQTPNLDWQLLTKRLENWRPRLAQLAEHEIAGIPGLGVLVAHRWLDGHAPSNVWLGTSVENQECAATRLPLLMDIPARVRFLSCEPLLGNIDLCHVVDWVIIGGESGPKARPFDLRWARALISQCRSTGVVVFMKQLGSNVIGNDTAVFQTKDKKGGDISEWPEDLQVRDFPQPVVTSRT